jgi:hypothetical protein
MVAAIPAALVSAAGTSSTSQVGLIRSSTTRSNLPGVSSPDPGPSVDIQINTKFGGRLIRPFWCDGSFRCSETVAVYARYICSGTFLPLNTSIIPQKVTQTFYATESGAWGGSTPHGYVQGPSPTCDGTYHYETIFIPNITNGYHVAFQTDRQADFAGYFEAALDACDLTGCTRADREYSLFISSPVPR